VKLSDLIRYGLWVALAETAFENRRTFRMATTWLPHFIIDSTALLLPDLVRLFGGKKKPRLALVTPNGLTPTSSNPDVEVITDTLSAMTLDNPAYTAYVAPVALGYIVSHPKFNIYKGEMAEMRFMGLGLDAIPHGTTAFTMVSLTLDSLEYAAKVVSPRSNLYKPIKWLSEHKTLLTGGILVGATFLWEVGEYRIHVYELQKNDNDITKINMMWSMDDTIRDVVANTLGWLIATIVNGAKKN
jgi:hypothetical protein